MIENIVTCGHRWCLSSRVTAAHLHPAREMVNRSGWRSLSVLVGSV